MEIGEDQLVAADEFVLGGDRLLDLEDHFGPGIDLFDGGEHLGPHTYIIIIGETAVHTGRSLHINLVSPLHELLSARRGKSNAILIVLDLFGIPIIMVLEVLGFFRPYKIRISS